MLRELARRDEMRGLDLPGGALFVVGLTGLVLGISRGGLSGWSDPVVIAGLVAGMLVTALGLALMTTLEPGSSYWETTAWLLLVGIGSGMFNSPNTAAMMGAVPARRRGIAAGTRTMVQNTGAVISIVFVLAIVTASIPNSTTTSLVGAAVSLLRPAHRAAT